MANNIVGNSPNAVVAKATVLFTEAGISSANTGIIYLADTVAKVYKSYVPGRGINAITGFVVNKGYIIQALADMDLSATVAPPLAGAGPVQLGTPTLILSVQGSTQIVLSWQAVANATGYILQRATDAGFSVNLATVVNNTGVLSYNDNILSANTTYYYRLKATASGYTDSAYDTESGTTSAPNSGTDYILDNFSGANDTLITARAADSGENWTARVNNFKITGNKAAPTVRNQTAIATVETDSLNSSAQITFTINNLSAKAVGIVFRYLDANNYYRVELSGQGNGFRIYQMASGSETLVTAAPAGSGNVIRMSLNGNAAIATHGTATLNATCSANPSVNRWGIYNVRSSDLNDELNGYIDFIDYFLWWPGNGAPPDVLTQQLSAPNLSLTVNSSTQITSNWAAVPNATGYTLQRATDAGFATSLTTLVNNENLLTYSDTGLTAATNYYYRLKAHASGYVDSAYDSDSATTQSGGAPSYILDQFNAANDTLLDTRATDTGQSWAVPATNRNFRIKGNAVTPLTNGVTSLAWINPGQNFGSAEVVVIARTVDGGLPIGILYRYVDPDNYYWIGFSTASGNPCRIVEREAGVETILSAAPYVSGNVIRMAVSGNAITATILGSSLSANATKHTISSKWGIIMARSSTTNDEQLDQLNDLNYFLWWPATSGNPPSNPIYP